MGSFEICLTVTDGFDNQTLNRVFAVEVVPSICSAQG